MLQKLWGVVFTNMNKPKILLIITIGFAIVVILSLVLFSGDSQIEPDQQPVSEGIKDPLLFDEFESTIEDPKLAIFDELIVGESTNEDIRRIPGIKDEESVNNGLEFHFPSSLVDRDNLAITQNNVLVYKRFIALKDVAQWESPSIIAYLEKYGEPELKKKGSVYFGNFATLYLWASKGVAIIGNDFTDEVFEVHIFNPDTVENYLESWGEDSTKFVEETPEDHLDELAL